MFGFSISKLIFTGVAIVAVWYGFRWFRQLQEREHTRVRERAKSPRHRAYGGSRKSSSNDDDVQTMIECGVCGSYVPASNARACGKENCPYPG